MVEKRHERREGDGRGREDRAKRHERKKHQVVKSQAKSKSKNIALQSVLPA
jgi:hypothetical protein